MNNDLSHTVFVYERKRKPYKSVVVYSDKAERYAKDKNWIHTATINPAAWIEYLLNHPKERLQQIEELFAGNKRLTTKADFL